jgi:protein-L-isoaspartate(D-aspartate) O-methyltransferase
MNFEKARFNMIEQQIRPWEVLDPGVLELLSLVKREDFVPTAYRSLAFVDMEIPLPGGQCLLAPRVEARLLQELAVGRHESVLEVGTGSGYMAALLAHRARELITVEIHPDLAAMARANLQLASAAVRNVRVVQADAAQGLPGEGPFDAVLLSGSVAQAPRALLEQLKIGGRMVAIVGEEPMMRAVRITRTAAQAFHTVELFDTVAPRLLGFDGSRGFVF